MKKLIMLTIISLLSFNFFTLNASSHNDEAELDEFKIMIQPTVTSTIPSVSVVRPEVERSSVDGDRSTLVESSVLVDEENPVLRNQLAIKTQLTSIEEKVDELKGDPKTCGKSCWSCFTCSKDTCVSITKGIIYVAILGGVIFLNIKDYILGGPNCECQCS